MEGCLPAVSFEIMARILAGTDEMFVILRPLRRRATEERVAPRCVFLVEPRRIGRLQMKSRPARETPAPKPRPDWYARFTHRSAQVAGRPVTFLCALGLVVVWAVAGPFVGFDETWQMTINTITAILTFLIVFLIQSTQNRDTLALQVKLAELILHVRGAPKQLADAEDMSEHQLQRVHAHYKARARKRMQVAKRRKSRRR